MSEPRKINTDYWMKPGPNRSCDWVAHFDGDSPNDEGQMAMGFGRTKYEAISDLLENHGSENDAPAIAEEVA